MTAPRRIQLQRTKGWRKPEGAIVVARPGAWGNPFDVRRYGIERAVTLYDDLVRGIWDPTTVGSGLSILDFAYSDHRAWRDELRRRIGPGHPAELAQVFLAGHDLACWCPLDQPCHADVLLAIANPQ
jgi:hypothetical protein